MRHPPNRKGPADDGASDLDRRLADQSKRNRDAEDIRATSDLQATTLRGCGRADASNKASRNVRRQNCIGCGRKFTATRRDASYCSGACRQRATRARKQAPTLQLQIDEARQTYWNLIRQKAEAEGKSKSQILTAQSQFVDEHGNVYMLGDDDMGGVGANRKLVGRVLPRPGWASWGLEAGGPPFSPAGLKGGAS
jgi:hypothetical protein